MAALTPGASYATLGERFGLSVGRISDHMVNHVGYSRDQGLTCQTCLHPDRAAIDALLRSGEACFRVSKRYGLPNSSLRRHTHCHLDNPEWEAKRAAVAAARLEAVRRYVDEHT